jgi:hypothetical protein
MKCRNCGTYFLLSEDGIFREIEIEAVPQDNLAIKKEDDKTAFTFPKNFSTDKTKEKRVIICCPNCKTEVL